MERRRIGEDCERMGGDRAKKTGGMPLFGKSFIALSDNAFVYPFGDNTKEDNNAVTVEKSISDQFSRPGGRPGAQVLGEDPYVSGREDPGYFVV